MKFGKFVALLFGAIALQVPLHAELPTKRVLTLDVAKTIAGAPEAEAVKRDATVVIVVVDDGGHLVYLERLNDTQVASVDVGIGKARTAAIFRRPSKVFEEQIEKAASQRCVTRRDAAAGRRYRSVDGDVIRRHRRQRQHTAGRRGHRHGGGGGAVEAIGAAWWTSHLLEQPRRSRRVREGQRAVRRRGWPELHGARQPPRLAGMAEVHATTPTSSR